MQEIHLTSETEWNEFVAANREGIESQGYSVEQAYTCATQGGFELGGGAAPLFVIFVDAGDVVAL